MYIDSSCTGQRPGPRLTTNIISPHPPGGGPPLTAGWDGTGRSTGRMMCLPQAEPRARSTKDSADTKFGHLHVRCLDSNKCVTD